MPTPDQRRFDEAAPTDIRRFDVGGELRRPHSRKSDGATLYECIATREGVLEYRRADGTIRRELVTREAVLDTARTLPRSTLTLDHPKAGFVTPDNVSRLQVGDVDGTAQVEEDAQGAFVSVKIAARRRDALDAIGRGVHEVSAGYDVTLDETPGEHPVHGRYDARQIGRECNHLAIVPKGRAGSTVALRTDSADAVQVPAPASASAPASRRDTMNPLLIALLASLGVDRFDSEDAALNAGTAAIKGLRARADAAPKYTDEFVEEMIASKKKTDEEFAALKADAEKKSGELAALLAAKEQAEKAEADRKDAADLARLGAVAAKVGVKADGLALPALKVAIAKTRIDSVDANTSPAFLDGVIAMVEKDATRSDGAERGRWDWSGDRKGERTDGAERREDDFFNPYLAHADEARKTANGGAQ